MYIIVQRFGTTARGRELGLLKTQGKIGTYMKINSNLIIQMIAL
jgi:hypothetical protein